MADKSLTAKLAKFTKRAIVSSVLIMTLSGAALLQKEEKNCNIYSSDKIGIEYIVCPNGFRKFTLDKSISLDFNGDGEVDEIISLPEYKKIERGEDAYLFYTADSILEFLIRIYGK